ncbi:hypothetical protein [Amycolatopsis sp. NPDC004079]|uniref:hypothetical protein n=1 Tax=Amycolatopsis sp. NPDC004079 TaxID=3154549 RepID=UPI00339F3BBF
MASDIRDAILRWKRETPAADPNHVSDLRFRVASGLLIPEEEPSAPGEGVIAFKTAGDITELTITRELAQRRHWRAKLTY